tara:strand:- start:526 stop:927 length:402 start_codon:yes stop_codon:yes gene_type:complete
MMSLNYFFNLLNLFLIFLYFIFINTNFLIIELEFLLIILILLNFIIKLYNWFYYKNSKVKNLNIILKEIFFNDNFTKLCILILSIVIPIYMILQRESLIIDSFVEKFSFFLVFIFSLIGFYIEFFILKNQLEK